MTRLREAVVRGIEELTGSTHVLDAVVLFHLLARPAESVARLVEHLTRMAHALQRRVELVCRVGHDVFVLAILRESVHAARHAEPVPLAPLPQPLLTWTK